MPDIDNYEALNSAITTEMGAPIVTKWLVLGELIDGDGDRSPFYVSSEQCALWDQLGLMAYHRQHLDQRINPGGDL